MNSGIKKIFFSLLLLSTISLTAFSASDRDRHTGAPGLPPNNPTGSGERMVDPLTESRLAIEPWMRDVNYLPLGAADISDPDLRIEDWMKETIIIFCTQSSGENIEEMVGKAIIPSWLIQEADPELKIELWMLVPLQTRHIN